MSRLRDAALEWASEGFAIFPCIAGGKTPACFWRREATTDLKRILKWWNEDPNYNIGLPTGDNFKESRRIEVLDVDVKNGNDGRWLINTPPVKKVIQEHSFATVITPSGGLHHYFRSADQPSGALKGVDFKATGGYVLVPPSEIIFPFTNGKGVRYARDYQFVKIREVTPNDKPFDWEEVRLTFGPNEHGMRSATGSRIYPMHLLAEWMEKEPSGQRNRELFKKACIAIESGYRDLKPLYDAALKAGLEHREIMQTVGSAERTYGIVTSTLGSVNGNGSYFRPDGN